MTQERDLDFERLLAGYVISQLPPEAVPEVVVEALERGCAGQTRGAPLISSTRHLETTAQGLRPRVDSSGR